MPSKLLRNGALYAPSHPGASALMIQNGNITWVGDESGASTLDADEVFDLTGNWLAPAFVDGHVHLAETGLSVFNSLVGCDSAEALTARLAAVHRFDSVLMAQGWDDSNWSQAPTDACLPSDIPSYVARRDLHSALINAALADLAPGIRSLAGWSDSGFVYGSAHVAARNKAISLLTDAEVLALGRLGLDQAAAHGIAQVHEMAGPDITGLAHTRRLMQSLSPRDPEVVLWWGELAATDTALELGAYGCGGDLSVDGSIGSGSAWFSSQYLDRSSCGNQYLAPEQVAAHLVACESAGMPASFHAIGDAALQCVCEGLAQAELALGRGLALPHQVEHATALTAEQLKFLAARGFALSVQPAFDAHWGGKAGMYAARLGERAKSLHKFGQWADTGAALVFGSDSPVTPIAPWSAVAHAAAASSPVSLRSAFRNHTASAYRRQGRLAGAIEVGHEANLALWKVKSFTAAGKADISRWARDPRSRTLPLPDVSEGTPACLATWRAGELIFEAVA